jgi:hypothetical protein|nr:MAG TPA: hypothetical protein [Caudoviricetes sp.]
MDALEFIKAIKQMLSAGANNSTVQKYISAYKKNDCEGMVKAAEQWAAEHPVKTRQSVFLEQFPNAPIYTNTHNVALDPCLVDTALRGHCPTGRGCDICRREFWLAEVEE